MRLGLTALLLAAIACSSSSSSTTVTQLAAGDPNCPSGGAAITGDGSTAYVCNGATGNAGATGLTGAPGPAGAAGPAGPPGPANGGLYVSRDNVYCNAATMQAGPTILTVAAACNNAQDLPLAGSCTAGSAVPNLTTFLNGPGFWEGNNAANPANWTCGWLTASSQNVNVPGATAVICCIRNS